MNIAKLEEKWSFSGNAQHFYELIKLMCKALAMCHIVGTAYFFLAICERDYLDYSDSWLQLKGMEESDVFA